ncbi:MAG: ABC transporter ATP-binding protein/permease [Bacilli bacterium]|jgi:putative ABC transport system permease protein|nr:ABC transporter ATP-binding protein/permease [Bacilli bacterium]
MLELKKITKKYLSGTNTVNALKGLDLKFRESEFVSILGPSGCGKTTLLNIIGGLDNYTSGDLIINGKSTKHFKDKDWDNYRNHSVGFVFQNYNLIPHQTVLSNVELALTLAGVSKSERKKRAIKALKDVGLEDQIYKKPNQMSGGQMQRVAIARALVSNPDILLADEPTGALDSKTSIQIMELLNKIAKDKLVIMVTHNPELAEKYSTRIIKLLDGNITNDSNPYEKSEQKENNNKIGKTNMSFKTALSLSLNNLLTKKGRTILTSFAGSIGIIGIALILSLSSGMQNYINRVEEDTLSSYPITLQEKTMDTGELLSAATGTTKSKNYNDNKIHSTNITSNMLSIMSSGAKTNNLYEFKKYITNNNGLFKKYANDIQYSYNLDLNIYKQNDTNYTLVNPDQIIEKLGVKDMNNMGELIGGASTSYNAFNEMLNNKELIKEQYDIIAGNLPQNYNEVVLLVNKDNCISDYALYAIGILDANELVEKYKTVLNGGKVDDLEELEYSYEELLNTKFKVLLNTDYYTKEGKIWVDKRNNEQFLKKILDKALELNVVGIIKAKDETVITNTYGGILYTSDLTKYVIDKINDSNIAKEQKNNSKINIFTNSEFTEQEFDMNNLSPEQKAYLSTLSQNELAEVLKNYQENAAATFESNLKKLGIVDLDKPSTINIYAKGFEDKEAIAELIEDYNQTNSEENQISYTDFIAVMMNGVSNIINIISYVLMAFVSISLVVSSIMIGIITYISVLERTKEIGILRSIGASKKDISRVFNAETLIIGASAGLLGIIVTILLNIPINIIIKNIANVNNISSLPINGAVILVLISMFLTVIAGLIPAKMASKKDPVEALRTE